MNKVLPVWQVITLIIIVGICKLMETNNLFLVALIAMLSSRVN